MGLDAEPTQSRISSTVHLSKRELWGAANREVFIQGPCVGMLNSHMHNIAFSYFYNHNIQASWWARQLTWQTLIYRTVCGCSVGRCFQLQDCIMYWCSMNEYCSLKRTDFAAGPALTSPKELESLIIEERSRSLRNNQTLKLSHHCPDRAPLAIKACDIFCLAACARTCFATCIFYMLQSTW